MERPADLPRPPTASHQVLFTSTSDIAHYLLNGTLRPDPGYVYTLLGLGFLSAFTGRVVAITLVARLSHPSLLAFLLATTLYVGLALLAYQMSTSPIDWSVDDLCS